MYPKYPISFILKYFPGQFEPINRKVRAYLSFPKSTAECIALDRRVVHPMPEGVIVGE
jgi:hypothetical protein